jgi:hypothetical protein
MEATTTPCWLWSLPCLMFAKHCLYASRPLWHPGLATLAPPLLPYLVSTATPPGVLCATALSPRRVFDLSRRALIGPGAPKAAGSAAGQETRRAPWRCSTCALNRRVPRPAASGRFRRPARRPGTDSRKSIWKFLKFPRRPPIIEPREAVVTIFCKAFIRSPKKTGPSREPSREMQELGPASNEPFERRVTC